MRAKPENEWRDYNVTARDLVTDSEIYVTFSCVGCRLIKEASVWRIGARLADDAIQRMRFKCSDCGVYAKEITIHRRQSKSCDPILRVKLNPAHWDDGHETAHRQALARADKARKAKGGQ